MQMDNMVDQSISMPLLSAVNKLRRDFMSPYKEVVYCARVLGSHLHWGRGADGGKGEKEFIGVRLLQLQEINNGHYVGVNASRRVSRGGAGPALPGSSHLSSHHGFSYSKHITNTTDRITSSAGKNRLCHLARIHRREVYTRCNFMYSETITRKS